MIPLNRSYQLFTLLCICPTDPLANRWIKLKYISFSISAIGVVFLGNISSYIFIGKYLKINLVDSLYACLQSAGFTTALLTLLTAFIQRNKIMNIFNDFQNFYDSSKNIWFLLQWHTFQCRFFDCQTNIWMCPSTCWQLIDAVNELLFFS